jgi:hypothetical protein
MKEVVVKEAETVKRVFARAAEAAGRWKDT